MRWNLRGARRQLAEAETHLGVLGWQQAEFDPQTQNEVKKITHCEREQARLTNESAVLAKTIEEIEVARDQAAKRFAEQRVPIDERLRAVRDEVAKTAGDIEKVSGQLPGFERRAAELDRELREVTRLHASLMKTDSDTHEVRAEQARMRDRTMAIPGEIAEIQTRRARVQAEIDALEKERGQSAERERALARELGELEAAHAKQHRESDESIREKRRQRARVEKDSARIEREKANPYLEIGRVLADSGVGPMNQPQALDDVNAKRLAVQELEAGIANLGSVSAAEDATLVRHSLILLAVIALALVLVIGALIPW